MRGVDRDDVVGLAVGQAPDAGAAAVVIKDGIAGGQVGARWRS